MARATYLQSTFLGGEWGPKAAHHIHDPVYKEALDTCINGLPDSNSGAWIRRSGFMYMAHTRNGAPAKLFAFDFNFSQPYNLLLSSGFARIFNGLGTLTTTDVVNISTISNANPAVATIVGNLPTTWANGDTVTLNLGGIPPSIPSLASRQFTIQSITTTTFALFDALTGVAVDGTSFSYVQPSQGPLDRVFKIFELVTPYAALTFNDVRTVQTPSVLTLLHSAYPLQSLTINSGVFALTQQDLTDGPYLGINTTTTTVTPSGTSGSVNLTFNSVTGINNGLGFSQDEIGRLVRIQGAPLAWSSATTYAKAATVLGSDNNIYVSASGGNTNNNPTTDNGTNWTLSTTTVTWTWAKITSVTSTTVVVATILGANLPSTAATTQWRLGLYSTQTGFPTCGVYHEGRLWLTGAATNRADASVPNDVFNFSPTAADGTVSDANAISATVNSDDNNIIYWMLSTDGGILMGARSGEWLLRATQIGDPITPANIQWKQTSTYGCANIEPIKPGDTNVFVQRQQRKLLDFDHYPYGEVAGWSAVNLAKYTSHLTVSGIAEVRYVQEPWRTIWMRRTDGKLIGTTFNHDTNQAENFNAWHQHPLGGSRTVYSISEGPTFDGLSQTLYAVLKDPTSGYYTVNAMAPMFDEANVNYQAVFTDGMAAPACSRELAVASGDSIDGLRLSGLTYVNSETVSVSIGGLDLGDYVVSTDHIDIPYAGTFTKAFLEGLTLATGYGVYSITVSPPTGAITYTSDMLGLYTTSPGVGATFTVFAIDYNLNRVYTIDSSAQILRVFDLKTCLPLASSTASKTFLGDPNKAFVNNPFWITNDGYLIVETSGSNSAALVKIDPTTLLMVGSFGSNSASLTSGPNGFVNVGRGSMVYDGAVTTAQGVFQGGSLGPANLLVAKGIGNNELVVLNCNSMTPWAWIATGVYGNHGTCPAKPGQLAVYLVTLPTVSAASFNLYFINLLGMAIGATAPLIKTVNATDIDATWSTINSATCAPIYDPTDGNLVMYVATSDAVTTKQYWVKLNAATGVVIWKTDALQTSSPFATPDGSARIRMKRDRIEYIGTTDTYYTLNTTAGTLATSAITDGTGTLAVTGSRQEWVDDFRITVGGMQWTHGSVDMTYINFTGAGFGATNLAMFGRKGPGSNVNWPPQQPFIVPGTIGAVFTSQGKLLRPDTPDGGAQNGPGFGKKKRNHKYSISLTQSQGVSVGESFSDMDTVPLNDDSANPLTATVAPTLFTGIVTETLKGQDETFDGQICWQISRPYPATVAGIGGQLETNDG